MDVYSLPERSLPTVVQDLFYKVVYVTGFLPAHNCSVFLTSSFSFSLVLTSAYILHLFLPFPQNALSGNATKMVWTGS